ncbi:helix-turn-helix domain-containing protein [Aureisphaera galaxeae]|uniref:AraC family transcriptional regulator n=1 Tax=Aureisphaera galaxeae TaxID=1538023 RepID=UPI002350BF03|nr:helix-turn-helix domain-containing protein [Aureisphaera galaxeae]MDC8002553.1 helix-turn-helix domain-containing protein [Aureisphaera galaxeae]
MVFEKYLPSHSHAHLIAYFWTLTSSENDAKGAQYRFVPDGYVDWVFHLGTPWQCDFPNEFSHSKTGRFHVFGQIKRYVNLALPKDGLDIFGVKFHPWIANEIWKTDMHYLTDSCIDLIDLELPEMKTLQEKVYLAKGIQHRMALIENYLSAHLNYKGETSLKCILSSIHPNDKRDYSEQLGIGTRRLEQRFKKEVGIPHKLFLRTQRINKIIGDLCKENPESLTQLALKHSYYDQSHFIRDFKQFTGVNPSQFLKSINPNGDILNLRVG